MAPISKTITESTLPIILILKDFFFEVSSINELAEKIKATGDMEFIATKLGKGRFKNSILNLQPNSTLHPVRNTSTVSILDLI